MLRAKSPSEEFAEFGYAVIRSVIPGEQRQFLFPYLLAEFAQKANPEGDGQVPGTPYLYGHIAGEALLESIRPAVEASAGVSLFPTYSYMRLYKTGDRLQKHRDRPACEFSATLCVGYTPDLAWPIWVEGSGGAVPVTLFAGDMLIYRGMELSHWREPYTGGRLVQTFLHYVDQNGPNQEWKFNKRPALNTR